MAAAEHTARVCYGMELDPRFVAVTLQRMKDMGLKPGLEQNGAGRPASNGRKKSKK